MPKTILLVEDTTDIRLMMKVMIEMLGHQVVEASNGSEAVEIAEGNGFDLVLMDLAMPIMDGIEATRRIKQIEKVADIPIIAVTAHSSKYHDKALKAGVTDIVKKPIGISELKPILLQYLH